ncbi:GerMN domain-containing protein [Christensenella intestinihominis]|uniref:GerMN domain-containing protein n=1 Tax=Christensenella intestinihominis TaxID=1851429 RepID=UPI00082F882A|nr:GerMN domain-containing protein [Christensenella intestinihominis]
MKKKTIITVIIVIAILLFTACTAEPDQQESAAVTTAPDPEPTIETTQIPSPVPVQTPGPSQEFAYDDSSKIMFKYWDEGTQEEKESTYEIDADAGNAAALEAVNQAFFGTDEIKANSITFSDGNLFIDFDDSIYNMNLGSSGEGAVLEAIANAYLENVQEINAVYYSVNGEDYSSGHIIQGKDQPFMTK